MPINTAVGDYPCDKCSEVFKTVPALGGHASRRHPKAPNPATMAPGTSLPSMVAPVAVDLVAAHEEDGRKQIWEMRTDLAHEYDDLEPFRRTPILAVAGALPVVIVPGFFFVAPFEYVAFAWLLIPFATMFLAWWMAAKMIVGPALLLELEPGGTARWRWEHWAIEDIDAAPQECKFWFKGRYVPVIDATGVDGDGAGKGLIEFDPFIDSPPSVTSEDVGAAFDQRNTRKITASLAGLTPKDKFQLSVFALMTLGLMAGNFIIWIVANGD